MLTDGLSRRGFLQKTMTGLLAAGLPAWYAQEVLAHALEAADNAKKPVAANDRIHVGLIGCGGQGTGDTNWAVNHKGVTCVAVCDVDSVHRERAAKKFDAKFQTKDFRELVARNDVDIVVIGTPDHWHALTAIAAMKKGKDVYCEKPMSLTIAEGQAMLATARGQNRVFQTGSQQRSDDRFRLACELVRNGRLGRIKTVETRIGDNPKKGPFPTSPIPKELDWDMWLGQTPYVDYVKERCHYEFRWWYEYSGGKMTDWGAHHNDIAQWGLGMDGNGPVEIISTGTAPINEPNSYNTNPDFTVTYTYAKAPGAIHDGSQVVCKSDGENGVKFIGEDGRWIFVDRGKITASDKKLLEEPLPSSATKLEVSQDHMGNFLDCVKSRKRPICDVEVGHRSVSVCHLGVISLRLGGAKLKWDPAKERFHGNVLADELLSRPMRKPWTLESVM